MTFAMQSTADLLEQRIRANRLLSPQVEWADELIFPYDDGLSIRSIPHTAAHLLGAPLPGSTPLDAAVWGGEALEGAIDRVILFISDGLSYRWLQHYMAEDEALRDDVAALTGGRGPLPLTSTCPSTTSTAMTTFWTGTGAAAHGMISYKVYLREIDTLAVPLFFRPAIGDFPNGHLEQMGLDPVTFVPVRGLADYLTQAGVMSHVYLRREYLHTGLSRILHRGLPPEGGHPHGNGREMWAGLSDLLARTRGQKCYVSVYWSEVDAISHVAGSGTQPTAEVIKGQLAELRKVLDDPAVRDGRTLVMLVADHGHYNAPNVINLKEDERAAPIYEALKGHQSGELRLPYWHLQNGHREQVIETIDRHFADVMTWLDPAEALAAGLFGPDTPYVESLYRLGDLIVVPRVNWVSFDGKTPFPPLISHHGGLSDWEMLVPMLWNRL